RRSNSRFVDAPANRFRSHCPLRSPTSRATRVGGRLIVRPKACRAFKPFIGLYVSSAMGDGETELANLQSTSPWLHARRLFTELFGTFLLVTVDAGGAVIAWASGGEIIPMARSLATGLVIMAMIYAM